MATMTAAQERKLQQALVEALTALVNQPGEGAKTQRAELAIDPDMNAAVVALADLLGGGMQRSKAIRELIKDGAKWRLAKMTGTA